MSDFGPEGMGSEEVKELARARIKTILATPELEPIQTEFGRLPIYGTVVGGSLRRPRCSTVWGCFHAAAS